MMVCYIQHNLFPFHQQGRFRASHVYTCKMNPCFVKTLPFYICSESPGHKWKLCCFLLKNVRKMSLGTKPQFAVLRCLCVEHFGPNVEIVCTLHLSVHSQNHRLAFRYGKMKTEKICKMESIALLVGHEVFCMVS